MWCVQVIVNVIHSHIVVMISHYHCVHMYMWSVVHIGCPCSTTACTCVLNMHYMYVITTHHGSASMYNVHYMCVMCVLYVCSASSGGLVKLITYYLGMTTH